MAFDGMFPVEGSLSTAKRPGSAAPPSGAAAAAIPAPAPMPFTGPAHKLPVDRLPFVGLRGDGQKSYWVMPGMAEGESQQLRARTYAAWFLIFAEANGPAARKWLLDRIEREMPSRYPGVDRVFLAEVADRS